MNIELLARPSAAAARIHLMNGETVTAELGAMIAMSTGLMVETTSKSRGGGGILKGLKRMFSGENFFLNHFTASADNQQLLIAPRMAGDIVCHKLERGSLVVQGSSWMASGTGVEIDTTFQGMTNALFSGEGMFWVKCTGQGDVLLNSFGAVFEVDVTDSYTVDTGHIVAFEDTLSFKIGKASGSLIGSFLGGEGLVAKFTGRGKLYCQTHNLSGFGETLGPLLKPVQG